MQKILQVRVEGLKNKPFWGMYTENYAKEIPEDPKTYIFAKELSEIKKRYSTIFRIEFFINKGIEELIPSKGEIDPKLVREAEEKARKRKQ